MSNLEGFTPQTRIGHVDKPGAEFSCRPFHISTQKAMDGTSGDSRVDFFNGGNWVEIFQGSVPAKTILLLWECSITEQERYKRYKHNPTGEYRPYRGHGHTMQLLFTLLASLVGVFVALVAGTLLLGFGWLLSVIVGVLVWLGLLGALGAYFHYTSKILNKKFARIFIEFMKNDESLKGKQDEVVNVLQNVQLLCTCYYKGEYLGVIAVVKEIIHLLK